MKTNPHVPGFPYASFAVDVDGLLALHQEIVKRPHRYKLGAKIDPKKTPGGLQLASKSATIEVDCSGYVRYLLMRCGVESFPDGSYIQREAIEKAGFKASNTVALHLGDEVLRIAFLSPQDGGGTGHVALWHNGRSIESHGGVGPDRRAPERCGWLSHAKVFVLTVPGK